jgi:hypothetical protein
MLQCLQGLADVTWQQQPQSSVTAAPCSKALTNDHHTATIAVSTAPMNGSSIQAAAAINRHAVTAPKAYVSQAVQTDAIDDGASIVHDTAISHKQAELIATLEQALAVAQQQLAQANSETAQLRSEVAALQREAVVRSDIAAAIAQTTAAAQQAAATAESSHMSVSTSLQALHSVCADAVTAAAVDTANFQQAVYTLQRAHSEHAAAHTAQLSNVSIDQAQVVAMLQQMAVATAAQRVQDEEHRLAAATAQTELVTMLKASQSTLAASNTQVRYFTVLTQIISSYFALAVTVVHANSAIP